MTYCGLKIMALLEAYRPSNVHISLDMFEKELARLGIKFTTRHFGDKTREYTLKKVIDELANNLGDLNVFADEDLRLVYQGIVSDGETAVCVEGIKTRIDYIKYYCDDIKANERKNCLIYRPCLMHDILEPVFVKNLFVQDQVVVPLPESVKIVHASHLLSAPASFVFLDSEAQEFTKLF